MIVVSPTALVNGVGKRRNFNGLLCANISGTCDHTLAEWMAGGAGWENRIELRDVPGMGIGAYSKVF